MIPVGSSRTIKTGVAWTPDTFESLAAFDAFFQELGPFVVDFVLRPALKAGSTVVLKKAKENLLRVTIPHYTTSLRFRHRKTGEIRTIRVRRRQRGRLYRALSAKAYVSKKKAEAVGLVGVRRGTRIRHAHLLEFGTRPRIRKHPKIIFAKAPHDPGYSGFQQPTHWLSNALHSMRSFASAAMAHDISQRLTPDNLKRYKKASLRLLAHRRKRDLMRAAQRAGAA